jgi:thiamine kinase-like enzyme
MGRQGAVDNLPAVLTRAIRELGIAPARITVLLNEQPWLPEARTFLIATDDDRLLKARITGDARRAAVSSEISELLSDSRVPTPVARYGGVTFEQWLDGGTLFSAGWSDRDLTGAADILGTIHRCAGAEREHLPHSRRTRPFLEVSLTRLAGPVRDGLIDRATGRRVTDALRDGLPERAPWGFAHGDFAPANLVATDSGQIASIDNERLHRGFLDLDLGAAWYRWPLVEREQRLFDAHCAQTAGRAPPAEIALWRVLAAIRRLGLRHRRGAPTTDARQRLGDALAGL